MVGRECFGALPTVGLQESVGRRRTPLRGEIGSERPSARSYLGSCSSGNDELARPSQAADDAARSERVCRCSRRTRNSALSERGQQGVGCSCVAAVDVVRQLSAAVWQARLVGTAA